MNLTLLSGQLYHLHSDSLLGIKRQLSDLLGVEHYFIKLLHPDTGLPLTALTDAANVYITKSDYHHGEDYAHYPRLFTRVDDFVYPILPPEEFRDQIAAADIVTFETPSMLQMSSLFSYMCAHLHPYAYTDYFPMLSYYHIDDEHPEDRLESSLRDKVRQHPSLGLSEEDLEEIQGKLFENDS